MTKKVCAYLRVSSKIQQDSGLSLEAQESKIRQYVKLKDAELVAVYKDVISGGKSQRPQLSKLLRDASEGRFSEVIVMSLDRLGRSTRDNYNLVGGLKEMQINLISLRESVDFSTPIGNVVFAVLSSLAEMELAIIRERVFAAKRQKFEQGKLNIFAPRFPLKWAKDGKSLVVDEQKLKIWLLIKKMSLEERLSYRQIIDKLNLMPSAMKWRSKPWNKVAIMDILGNRDLVNGFVPLCIKTLEGEEIKNQVPCPKLLSEEEWQTLQGVIASHRSYQLGGKKKGHLLSKMLRCHRCGNILWLYSTKGRRYFRCSNKKCTLPYLPVKTAEREIKTALITATQDWSKIEEAIRLATLGEDEVDLQALAKWEKQLKKKQAEVRVGQRRLIAEVEAGNLSGQAVKERDKELNSTLNKISEAREEINNQRALADQNKARKEELKKSWQRVMRGWSESTEPQQRAILQSLFREPGSIVVDYSLPYEDEPAGWNFRLEGVIPINIISGKNRGHHTNHGIGM